MYLMSRGVIAALFGAHKNKYLLGFCSWSCSSNSTLRSPQMSQEAQLWPITSKGIEFLFLNQKTIFDERSIICGMGTQQKQQQSKQIWLMMKRGLYTNLHDHTNGVRRHKLRVMMHLYVTICELLYYVA
jgi:hypothetical protein